MIIYLGIIIIILHKNKMNFDILFRYDTDKKLFKDKSKKFVIKSLFRI